MASSKVLGTANYYALRSPTNGMVSLTAIGLLPCANYSAQLEMRPERPIPPNWNLVFFVEDLCLRAIKPFNLTVEMVGGEASEILVFDANGTTKVPISDPYVPFNSDATLARRAEKFLVYAKIPLPNAKYSKRIGCIVVPESTIVLAIYYRVFGPASREVCEKWSAENCVRADDAADIYSGGEVPWPLVIEN